MPSRALLDGPVADSLRVVPACRECNQASSLDEPYLACSIDGVVARTTVAETVALEAVRRILRERPVLAARLAASRHVGGSGHTLPVKWPGSSGGPGTIGAGTAG